MTPKELLDAARPILGHTGGLAPALWPRAAAILARHALESAVRDMWTSRPGYESLAQSSMRAQLISLIDIIDPSAAARASFVWSALSEACHYHPYELAPTAGELSHWIDEVEQIVTSERASVPG